MYEGKLYFVKTEYAPSAILTKEDKLFEVLDHLAIKGHAVVPPQIGSKSFTFKHQRGILKELGGLMYIVLSEFDYTYEKKIEDDRLTVSINIDKNEVLKDLEWIEEIMEEG
ncbi:hypothetical protein H1230_17000 [Paenibacillus sp. 19GGS1-52]|uniref:hypothetical protein n=1 Tax=Paenibacillus sp. 19GGS1-52 TaxID=2758563 RepID=UPI001EFAA1ED|nr:hypothetical protein [Paenibacillus sp. 19GGS1-52]ULO04843.1 hypothetical protein H1230_17000 [Paenibacillus sp. 19GGS1-52]